jgi:hypothetical protein
MFYIFLIIVCIILFLYWGASLFKHKYHHNVQEGEVFVNGKGHISLKLLCKRPPKFVSVNFTDNFHSHPCHPCNPHHDWFDWDVVKESEHCYKFTIYYDVGNIREISYKITY